MFGTEGITVPTGGRPRKNEGKVSTKHVRINDDLAEMLSWVLRALGKEHTSAQILDPHIRGPITALYNKHEATIRMLKKAHRQSQKEQEVEGEE
jgi:hypothetical protein